MGPLSWSGEEFATERFPEQAHRAVPALSRYAYQGAFRSRVLERHVWPAASRWSAPVHQEINEMSKCLDVLASAQLVDERPATYRL